VADRFGDGSAFEIDPVRDDLVAGLGFFARNFLTRRNVDILDVAVVRRFEDGFARLLFDPFVALKGAAACDKNQRRDCNGDENPFH
jgi:hypothetical protein